jgi:hypothetical protein
MGVCYWSQAAFVQMHAIRFWFYSISCAILSIGIQMLGQWQLGGEDDSATQNAKAKQNRSKKNGKEDVTEKAGVDGGAASPPSRMLLLRRQLIVNLCDLTIPGSRLGWIQVNLTTVALATSVSSVIAGQDIWNRVNPKHSK